MPEQKATFNRAVDEAFAVSQAISNQRGGEYSDSWALEFLHTRFLDNTLDMIDLDDRAAPVYTPEEKRLIVLASMCDVKVSRLVGPWKADTYEDLLNYLAAYTTLAKEYRDARG